MIRVPIFLFIWLFLYGSFTYSQVNTAWIKTFGGVSNDAAYSVKQTSDGGYILVGETSSFGAGNSDVWLIKTNYVGDTLWTKTFGGNSFDFGYSVKQITNGGYILTGWTRSFNTMLDYDVWLINLDSNGNTIWTKRFGGNYQDGANSVDQTLDGGFIITGFTESFGVGGSDVWLIKTNSSGDTVWTKTFGGINNDFGSAVRQTSDGGYIITGYTESFGAGARDVWLIKTDILGNLQWSQTFGGNLDDRGFSSLETSDGGYIVTGFTESFGSGGSDVLLIKTDINGNPLWYKTYGGVFDDGGYAIIQTSDGGFMISAHTASFGTGGGAVWMIKTDEFGDSLWTRIFNGGGFDRAFSVQQTTDYGYIITGSTSSFGAGGYDVWLIKTTPDITNIGQTSFGLSSEYSLSQNYPNPFNSITEISWYSPIGALHTLKVFDILGNEVATLINEYLGAGKHKISFNAFNLASGLYIYKLQADDFIENKKMIYLK